MEPTQATPVSAEADHGNQSHQQYAAEENNRREALRDEASLKHDLPKRRERLAACLDGVANKEAMQARLSADQG